MTRRKSKRHLGFDSLEAMQLLSGAAHAVGHAMARHGAHVHHGSTATVGDEALALSGTVQGNYRIVGGSSASFVGRGNVSPLGRGQLRGNIGLAGGGLLTLNFGRKGKVMAAIVGQESPNVLNYQITGGTRRFAGDSGKGLAIVNIAPSGNQIRGHFSLMLQGSPTS